MFQDKAYIGHGIGRAQGEADTAVNVFIRVIQGHEDGRRLETLGIAGGTGIDHDAKLVEMEEYGFAFDVENGNVQEIG